MPNSVSTSLRISLVGNSVRWPGPSTRLLKAHEIAYVISNSEAKALLVHSDFLPTLESIRVNWPRCDP